ncbi:DUF4259 domain-containing protein [Lysobacter sp. A286]
MGTWAIDSFGNDDAADWLCDLTEQNDLGLVREAIARVLATDGYLEAPDATQALAAIEVVAAALGRPTGTAKGEGDLMAWVARVKPVADTSLASQANQAVDRILGPESELRELWEEAEEFGDWQKDVAALRSQLQV